MNLKWVAQLQKLGQFTLIWLNNQYCCNSNESLPCHQISRRFKINNHLKEMKVHWVCDKFLTSNVSILLIWLTQTHQPFIFRSYGWHRKTDRLYSAHMVDIETPTVYIPIIWLIQTQQPFIFCPNGWHRHQPFETLVSWARREPGRSWSAPRTFSSPKNRRRWMLLLLQMMTLTRKRPPTKIFWPSDKDLKNKENIKTKVQSNLVWKVMSERWYFCTK